MATEVELSTSDSSPTGEQTPARPKILATLQAFLAGIGSLNLNYRWSDYAQGLGLVMLVTLVSQPLASLDHANIVMLYLLVEVIAAVRFGLGPGHAHGERAYLRPLKTRVALLCH